MKGKSIGRQSFRGGAGGRFICIVVLLLKCVRFCLGALSASGYNGRGGEVITISPPCARVGGVLVAVGNESFKTALEGIYAGNSTASVVVGT